MKNKIIALDVDGTLVKDDSYPSDTTINEIRKLNQEGYKIVLTTGRSYLGAKDLYETLQLKTPAVFCNGYYVYDPINKKVLHEVRIPREFIYKILNHPKFNNLLDNIILEYQEQSYTYKPIKWQGNPIVGDFYKTLPLDPTSCVLVVKNRECQELTKQMIEEINSEYSYRYWGDHFGEVYKKDVSKSTGIEIILKYYNKTFDDLIFFGDAQNDLEILQKAKIGVAMKNAKEFIKQKADQITEYTNQEDRCVRHILKMIKEDKKDYLLIKNIKGKKYQRLLEYLKNKCNYFSWSSLKKEELSIEYLRKSADEEIEKYEKSIEKTLKFVENFEKDAEKLEKFKVQINNNKKMLKEKVFQTAEFIQNANSSIDMTLPEDFQKRIFKKKNKDIFLNEYIFELNEDNFQTLLFNKELFSGLQINEKYILSALSFYKDEEVFLSVDFSGKFARLFLNEEEKEQLKKLKIKLMINPFNR